MFWEVLIAALVGAALGALAAWLMLHARGESGRMETARLQERCERLAGVESQLSKTSSEFSTARADLAASKAEVTARQEEISRLQEAIARLNAEHEALASTNSKLIAHAAELQTSLDAERKQNTEKIALLQDARTSLSEQFKVLAGEILEEKTKKFTEQNHASLGQILDPLKLKIDEFRTKVEAVYVQEGKDRSALGAMVSQLVGLNQQLSAEAHDLTRALKGSSKAQGNWGEFILESILESSGLRKDLHYHAQQSFKREDGSRAQPDFVVHLPEKRDIVVDSKVSLTDYERYVNAAGEADAQAHLARHIESMKAHIKELADTDYLDLYGLKTLDSLIMFVPVEPAFTAAIQADSRLLEYAWSRNIIVLSPTTLIFALRIVANLWRQEEQSNNVQEIAKRGGFLYDKFVAFVQELQKVGEKLLQARQSYEDAFGKLTTERGNLVRQAEMLKELGVKPAKALPQGLVDAAVEEPQALTATAGEDK
jgi:DNA recombination protein RmuC